MSDKAAKLISAGLFALALSYFLVNLREVYRVGGDSYVILNHLTGTNYCHDYRCFKPVFKDGAERVAAAEAAADAAAAEEAKWKAEEKAAAEERKRICNDPSAKSLPVSCWIPGLSK